MNRRNDVTITYLSDAHLGSGGLNDYTEAACAMRLKDVMESSQLVVFNGDMFELPFSNLGFSRTVARAISTLEYILTAYPKVEINYVIGNHDGDRVFVAELQKLANKHHNLQVSENYFLIEGKLAGHGDLMSRNQSIRDTEFRPQFSFRRFISELQVEGQRLLGKKYDKKVFQPHQWSPIASAYLNKNAGEQMGDIKEIITGHTHVPFEQFNYDGKIYSNTGTMFDAESYYPLKRTISAEAFEQYKNSKPSITCHEMLTDGEKRATKRIENYMGNAEDKLKKLEKKHGSFAERIHDISKTYRNL